MCEQNGEWENNLNIEPEVVEKGEPSLIILKFKPAEELPVEQKEYLVKMVTDDESIRYTVSWYFKRDDKPELSRWAKFFIGKVIAWAELPEMPV